jgi:hypothetical protein
MSLMSKCFAALSTNFFWAVRSIKLEGGKPRYSSTVVVRNLDWRVVVTFRLEGLEEIRKFSTIYEPELF